MCLAVPAELVEITDQSEHCRTGKARIGSILREVNLACVPEAQVGDYLLVHAGVAISVIAADEAEKVFEYLVEIELLAANQERDQ
jgi:hydrogenase expression/formation protein HypC